MGFFPKLRTAVDALTTTSEAVGNGTESVASSVASIANSTSDMAQSTGIISGAFATFTYILSTGLKIIGGTYACAEGACAIADGVMTPNPLAKGPYIVGGAITLLSGVVILISAPLNWTCGPVVAGAVAGFGLTGKHFGNRVIDATNVTNPLPAITKTI